MQRRFAAPQPESYRSPVRACFLKLRRLIGFARLIASGNIPEHWPRPLRSPALDAVRRRSARNRSLARPSRPASARRASSPDSKRGAHGARASTCSASTPSRPAAARCGAWLPAPANPPSRPTVGGSRSSAATTSGSLSAVARVRAKSRPARLPKAAQTGAAADAPARWCSGYADDRSMSEKRMSSKPHLLCGAALAALPLAAFHFGPVLVSASLG